MASRELTLILKAKDDLSKTLGGISDTLGTMGKVAAGVGLAAGGALIGIGGAAVKAVADFDGAMREVNSLINLNEKDFGALSAQTNELAKNLGVDAVEASKALYQAISAGVPADNAVSFMEVATKAAIGGVTDTTTAVDGLTTVINAFKMPMTDAEKVADIMFTTVKQGKTTMGELSASMSNVAPMAAAAGVSFEEVSASIATLTKQGVPTAQATTQIRAAMQGLLKPTDALANAFADMGYESGQAAVDALGFNGALAAVSKRVNGDVGQLSALFGSVEAVGAVLGTTGKNAEMFAGDLKAMQGAAGASNKAFEEMNKSVGRQMDRLKAVFQSTLIEVGAKLLPVITPIIEKIGTALPGAINAVMPAVTWLIDGISRIAGAVMEFGENVQSFAEFDGNVFAALIDSVAILLDLDPGAWASSWDAIPIILQTVGERIVGQLGEWAAAFIAWIGPMIPPLLAKLGELELKFLGWIVSLVPPLITQLGLWVRQFVAFAERAIPPLLAQLGILALGVLDWIKLNGPPFLEKLLGEWLPAFIGWVAETITALMPLLADLLAAIVNWIINVGAPKLLETAGQLGLAVVNGIRRAMRGVSIPLPDFHIDWGDITKGILPSLSVGVRWQPLGELIPELAQGARNFAGGLAWVGERGPELVQLPRGANVYSTAESRGMAMGATYNITVNTNATSGTYLADIEMARAMAGA